MRAPASLPVVAFGFEIVGLDIVLEGLNLLLQLLHDPHLLLGLRLQVAAEKIQVVVVGRSNAGGSSISRGKIAAGLKELPLALPKDLIWFYQRRAWDFLGGPATMPNSWVSAWEGSIF